MIRVALIRHGEDQKTAEGNAVGLSAVGREQAESAALALQEFLPFELVSSPLPRATETAQIISKLYQIPVRHDARLKEVGDGLADPEARRRWVRAFLNSTWAQMNAETLSWRTAVIDSLLSSTTNAVWITHLAVINAITSWTLGDTRTMHFAPFHGSITTIHVENGAVVFVALGAHREWHP